MPGCSNNTVNLVLNRYFIRPIQPLDHRPQALSFGIPHWVGSDFQGQTTDREFTAHRRLQGIQHPPLM